MDLETKIIRTVWNLVETANPYSLLKLSDGELIQKLISEVTRISSLSSAQSENLAQYVSSRTVLIRDLASYTRVLPI